MARLDNQNVYIKEQSYDRFYPLSRGDIIESNRHNGGTGCVYRISNISRSQGGTPFISLDNPNSSIFSSCSTFKTLSATPENVEPTDKTLHMHLHNNLYIYCIPHKYTIHTIGSIMYPLRGGKSTPKGPQPSDKRVVVKGQKRVVYVGPKGGRYIKSKGKFVRI